MPKKYTFEQLRLMLKGVQWSDFHYRRKHDKHFYYDTVHNVHFMAYVEMGDSKRPSLRVKGGGEVVVLKFIDKDLYTDLSQNLAIQVYVGPLNTLEPWRHALNQLGPVVRSDE